MSEAIVCCPECGTEQVSIVTRGDLEAYYQPPFVFYKGVRIGLTYTEGRMIYMLLRRQYVSSDALAIMPNGEYAGQESLRTRLTRIRQVFKKNNIPFKIASIFGYGYEIKEIA